MGGFMLFDEDGDTEPLDPMSLEPYLLTGQINISEEEIGDRSKGDLLSKGLALFQTGWFVAQCVARVANHLPIAEIEVVTLAFAVLNFATYGFWWDKPHDVRCAVPVLQRPIVSHQRQKKENRLSEGLGQVVQGLPTAVTHAVVNMRNRGRQATVQGVLLTILRTLYYPVLLILDVYYNVVNGGRGQRGVGNVVSTFYAGNLTDKESAQSELAVAVVAAVFGGIHFVAWTSQFPSRMEQMAWRMCSIAMVCVPLLFLFPIAHASRPSGNARKSNWLQHIADMCTVLGCVLYVLARSIILVLAFISLRSLPPGAYQTVDWTTYLPHI
jgi:hypothetical protein